MTAFSDGYKYFIDNSSSIVGSGMGADYVDAVQASIDEFKDNINSFQGYNTDISKLKGDVAEFWHAGTFNINAAVQGSDSHVTVDRSHDYASADITSNFDKLFGLKYYKTGAQSAKEQSKSIFEKYCEYKAKGGKDSLEKYLADRNLDNTEDILNDPIYLGQVRIIPSDQYKEAIGWLERKIQEESVKRPEQVKRYVETLKMLKDKIEDGKGVESITLTEEEAKKLAQLAKEGAFTDEELKKLGISTEDLIEYKYVLHQAFKAGMTAATISLVLKVAPEIYRAINILIEKGELDAEEFKRIGFAALTGSAEGFVRGSVAAGITTACKAGLWGEMLKEISPGVIGAVTTIAISSMKNSFKVANGTMTSIEFTEELIKEVFVSTSCLVMGHVGQALINIPVFGYMLGSFVGSALGSVAYDKGYKTTISFCVDTGFTLFGLVEQNYELPEEILRCVGIDVFEYDKFYYDEFEFDEFKFDEFELDEFQLDEFVLDGFEDSIFNVKLLKRGVISVNKIGYI